MLDHDCKQTQLHFVTTASACRGVIVCVQLPYYSTRQTQGIMRLRAARVRHACAVKTRVIMHIHGRHISPAQRASMGMDQNAREIDSALSESGELARTTS